MTFLQLKNTVLKLINQYSVAGNLVAPSYNNQQDYLNRIAVLADDAVMEIATTTRKIQKTVTLVGPEEEDPSADELVPEVLGDFLRYEMPQDFYQFKSGDILTQTGRGRVFHTRTFLQQGRTYLLVPKQEIDHGEKIMLTYYRYPNLLGDNPQPSAELDNLPETHTAVAFYVAAFLAMPDDPFEYASLYNKYEDKLVKMGQGFSAETHPVADVYGFSRGDEYFC